MSQNVSFCLRNGTFWDISNWSDGEATRQSPLTLERKENMHFSIRLRLWKVTLSFTIQA